MSRTRPTTNDQRHTIASWLQKNTVVLQSAGIESHRLDCLVLLENVLGKDRAWIAAHGDKILDDATIARLYTFITQRSERIPLAYILGSKEFYGREFIVTKDVLIPRPESEAMIELLLDIVCRDKSVVGSKKMRGTNSVLDSRLRSSSLSGEAAQASESNDGNDESALPTTNYQLPTILDIGTGSGCLAITAKLELPEIAVIATDISKAALKIAQKNARNLGADIQLQQSDLLSELPGILYTSPCILLANLPYVPNNLITSKEITKEPATALFSGGDGLDHYRKFWQQITALEDKPTHILTESLKNQHAQLSTLASQSGYHLSATNDLAQHFVFNN